MELPFLWIDGSFGAGKTTLIERLLESNRKRQLAVVRFRASDSVTATEADNGQHEECKRYEDAEAVDQLHLTYPKDIFNEGDHKAMQHVRDVLWNDCFGEEAACDALICEGSNDFAWRSSLRVFVARPLPEGQSLVTRERREVLRYSLQELLDLGILPAADSSEVESIENAEWETVEAVQSSDELSEVERQLLDIAENGMPVCGQFWELHAEYRNIMKAAVIVINIHSEQERAAASALIEQINRLRTDPELNRDLSSRRDYCGRLSIFVCNLTNSKDHNLVKALARIKRPIQEFCPRYGFQLSPV